MTVIQADPGFRHPDGLCCKPWERGQHRHGYACHEDATARELCGCQSCSPNCQCPNKPASRDCTRTTWQVILNAREK